MQDHEREAKQGKAANFQELISDKASSLYHAAV